MALRRTKRQEDDKLKYGRNYRNKDYSDSTKIWTGLLFVAIVCYLSLSFELGPSQQSIHEIHLRSATLHTGVEKSVSTLNSVARKVRYYKFNLSRESSVDDLRRNLSGIYSELKDVEMKLPPEPGKRKTRNVRKSRGDVSLSKYYKLNPDSKIDNLTYFKLIGRNMSMSMVEIRERAAAAVRSKGTIIAYNNSFGSFPTRGTVFQYRHNYTDNCMVHYISLKYDAGCGDNSTPPKYIYQLLVVAVQRSGTHYTWEMLNRLKVHVHHEGVGPNGSVSWPYAVNAFKGPGHGVFSPRSYVINNPVRATAKTRFKHVFHQVRHPLRVLSTLVNRCAKWDNYWNWISMIKGCEAIKKDQTPLKRGMLLYWLWNKHIERYADIRFRTETTSPRDICLWAGFSVDQCSDPGSPGREIIEPSSTEYLEALAAAPHPDPEPAPEGEEGEEAEEGAELDPQEGEEEGGAGDQTEEQARALTERDRDQSGLTQAGDSSYGNSSGTIISGNLRNATDISNSTNTTIVRVVITWADLDKEDIELSEELKMMCLEYGYDLDPNVAPQVESSHKFTA